MVAPGWVAAPLRAEYAGLGLWWTAVRVAGRAENEGRARLHRLSDGYHPEDVLRGRRTPAHDAARVFARQVGLEPDAVGLRADIAARETVVAGRLVATAAVADALLAVAVTSGVEVVALDARRVAGTPGLDLDAHGTIVVADGNGPIAPLFGDPSHRPRRDVVLVAVEVLGAPPLETEEALWQAGRFLTCT